MNKLSLSTGLRAATAALLAAPLMSAQAASVSASFSVTASVVDACSVSATDLAFGEYDSSALLDKTATSTISVRCSLGTPYQIGLDGGTYASGATRRMASGANRLNYEMYRDPARSLIFGTIANLLGVSGIGTGLTMPTTIYGTNPAGQVVSIGSYSDQVMVTVEY